MVLLSSERLVLSALGWEQEGDPLNEKTQAGW